MLCIVAFPLFFVFYTVHMINEREKKLEKKVTFEESTTRWLAAARG